ncbi:3-isopropylmalate dehydrogenase [Brevibacillus sp. SYP-B805]|uniref:3-isopropylmalate dehydrogenase n=1 Tax=Brevibacillus sp. SYP-B805 TaxID=1578199 RepID=UPI0013EBC5ED|nr:3-isopropylmalate dehydrogenase [Brevibacillus sp. SYP-B805]NGQ94464.1 3-isopropylmalate dehydrogenase [Brevibacillus sp. SYP-B805]
MEKKNTYKIAVLPGDGIGPEIVAEAVKVLGAVAEQTGVTIEFEYGRIGGIAIDTDGTPLPEETLEIAKRADAVLLGAVGGPKWDQNPGHLRPETGLLGIRKALGLFANIRPATMHPSLVDASSLKPEVVSGVDLIVVRELTGGIYFGEKKRYAAADGGEVAEDLLIYHEAEIERILRVAFELARKRSRRLVSVDKANVLESSRLWRKVAERVAADYPDVELSHMLVDSCAMQLVRAPKQFDVIVTENMFGDILSDQAAMLTGSIGMLASASLAEGSFGLYEPVHGSAPDIAGKGIANPLATILSAAMLLRHSLGLDEAAAAVEQAVWAVLEAGHRTGDIAQDKSKALGTVEIGQLVLNELAKRTVKK